MPSTKPQAIRCSGPRRAPLWMSGDEHETTGDNMTDTPFAGLTLRDAQQILAAQPFSVFLGARIAAFADGRATLEIDVRDELLQQNGYLHGGVLAYAADNALTFAGGSALGPTVLTRGFTIDYLMPARGRTLQARAEVIQASRRQATCRCDLYMLDAASTVAYCAAAQGRVTAIRPAPPP
jgi:uncharacterized protein (TIGR00369 family)